ncbi:MAG: thiamine pyrophosphate-dependent enzyme [Phycisphaerales bacterium]|nr:thiamine pyrophosphate-dependent enzyme [Phycisphaerales bacterium]
MTVSSVMDTSRRMLVSGNEAVTLGARDAGVTRGTGYPGTPSTEILENFAAMGGQAAWSPNEKVALEVATGVAMAGGRALCTMKHVGVNVAADILFTLTYAGIKGKGGGALVLVSADDPGMHSSQNEQDNRRYAVAAVVPMLEPADSQEAYDMTRQAFMISERWHLPVMLRMTTRVCHSKTILQPGVHALACHGTNQIGFERNIPQKVMIPAHARPAHRRLRQKMAEMQQWLESTPELHPIIEGNGDGEGASELGIITSGISYVHVREAAPDAKILKLGMTYPLPMQAIRAFAESVKRCVVIEEGDPYLKDAIRAAGIAVESKSEMYRFGELNVGRVRRILARDESPEAAPPRGKPPQLCPQCPYHPVFAALKKLECIVSGDIGCYTLGALQPWEAMDIQLCMGAGIGVGVGLRHTLPEDQAKCVVSVIGDSTFMHSGLTGLAEMIYNPPPTGHVLIILDNGTTAMTGQQEHPGTGRTLNHEPTGRVVMEDVARAMGANVDVLDAYKEPEKFEELLRRRLEQREISVIISRRPCILAAGKIREYERRATGTA